MCIIIHIKLNISIDGEDKVNGTSLGALMLTFLSSTYPSCRGFAVDTLENTIVTNVTTGNDITIITTAYHLS